MKQVCTVFLPLVPAGLNFYFLELRVVGTISNLGFISVNHAWCQLQKCIKTILFISDSRVLLV